MMYLQYKRNYNLEIYCIILSRYQECNDYSCRIHYLKILSWPYSSVKSFGDMLLHTIPQCFDCLDEMMYLRGRHLSQKNSLATCSRDTVGLAPSSLRTPSGQIPKWVKLVIMFWWQADRAQVFMEFSVTQ